MFEVPKEFTGESLAPPEYPTELAQRGGHIPGAKNIPWSDNDGTFKSADELKKIYESKRVTPDKEVIVYCRIGERSSHTRLVLKYLLGYPNVKNYDGSWTEWGNIIASPIEKKRNNLSPIKQMLSFLIAADPISSIL
jgi:thiosulfate/3-mercaptopyruvate sulfurtransferase